MRIKAFLYSVSENLSKEKFRNDIPVSGNPLSVDRVFARFQLQLRFYG